MAVELGVAYLSLSASSGTFAKDVEKELGGVEKAAQRSGERSSGKLGGALSKGLKRSAQATGLLAGGLIGAGLVKGFGRLRSIDDARGSLRGLGHDAKSLDAIMADALTSVKGTAFGLDEAASAAAGAVAAGIKPGEDLAAALTLVGDAATIGGTSMTEMGSIFNKVATANKVQADVFNQLHDRGIPIVQMLSDTLGIAAGEVTDLARAGKIDFKMFQTAMQSGLGGAAQEGGKTFSGAMANAQAALGRLGASALSGVFSRMPEVFAGIIARLDEFGPKAEELGKRLGDAFAQLPEVWARIGPTVMTVVGNLQTAFAALVPAVIDLGHAVMPVAKTIGVLLVGAVVGVSAALAAAAPYVASFAGWLRENEGVVKALGAAIGVYLIPSLVAQVKAWAVSGAAAAKSAAVQLAANGRIMAGWVATASAAVASGATTVRVWAMYQAEAIKGAAAHAASAARVVGGWVLMGVQSLLGAAKVAAAWLIAMGPIGLVIAAVAGVVALVVANWDTIKRATVAAWNAVVGAVKWAVDLIVGHPQRMMRIYAQAGRWLIDAGKNIVTGLLNGIKSMAMAPVNAVKDIGNSIVSGFKGVLGIASPSKVGTALGENVTASFATGMLDRRDDAKRGAEHVAGVAAANLDASTPARVAGQRTSASFANGMANNREPVKLTAQNIGTEAGVAAAAAAATGWDRAFPGVAAGMESQGRAAGQRAAAVAVGEMRGAMTATGTMPGQGWKDVKMRDRRRIQEPSERIKIPDIPIPEIEIPVIPTLSGGGGGGRSGGGGSKGGSKAAKSLTKAVTKALTPAQKAAQALGESIGGDFVRSLVDGSVAQIRSSTNKLVSQINKAFGGKKSDRLAKMVVTRRNQLIDLTRKQTRVTMDLEKAEERLQKVRDMASSVSTAMAGNISHLRHPREAANWIRERALQVKQFGANLKRLAARGLPATLLNQIVEAGLDGAPLAASLARASGSDFKLLVGRAKSLESESRKVGDIAAKANFGVGVAAADGIVKGLKAREKRIEAQMLRIAKLMQSTIKRALKIKSPSRVFDAEVGQMVGAGVAQGVDRSAPMVDASLQRLVQTPRVGALVPAGGAAGRDGYQRIHPDDLLAMAEHMARVQITVQADKRELARSVAEGNRTLASQGYRGF